QIDLFDTQLTSIRSPPSLSIQLNMKFWLDSIPQMATPLDFQ
ncbi:23904_t:CDS:1, partial [Dentiscutata erythropus]